MKKALLGLLFAANTQKIIYTKSGITGLRWNDQDKYFI